jgi:RNA polymerase sigma factor (sigma-70 family)
MSESQTDTAALVQRLPIDGPTGRAALIARTCERLRRHAHRMLKIFPVVARWEQTDDVLQNALVRLCRALEAVTPENARHFYSLAERQIHWELLDLAARHKGPQGFAANHHTDSTGGAVARQPDPSDEPQTVAEWTKFHSQIEQLPEEEREVFGLLWYHGLSQEQAAEVLGVSVRTVKRRWQNARLALARSLGGVPPPS